MAYSPISAIDVIVWGRKAGALALDPSSGFYAFEYYPDFRTSGIELAPLSQPLSTGAATLGLIMAYSPVSVI